MVVMVKAVQTRRPENHQVVLTTVLFQRHFKQNVKSIETGECGRFGLEGWLIKSTSDASTGWEYYTRADATGSREDNYIALFLLKVVGEAWNHTYVR